MKKKKEKERTFYLWEYLIHAQLHRPFGLFHPTVTVIELLGISGTRAYLQSRLSENYRTTSTVVLPIMLTINLHGGRQLAVPTPKHTGQSGTPKARGNRVKTGNLQTQPFKVAHQRVNLHVDLAQKLISGFTEITLMPLSTSLRVVRLDAREMKIKKIYINGSPCANYIHRDLLYVNDPAVFEECVTSKSINLWDVYAPNFSVHQHHLLRQKLNYIFGDIIADQYNPDKLENTNTEELRIILPDNLKIELVDANSFHSPTSVPGLTPLQMRTKNTLSDSYAPIQIGVEYELINPKEGVNFVSDPNVNKKFWHVYTVNSEYNVSTSSWVPCVDNLWERNTWSFEISIPRSTKNIPDLSALKAESSAPENDEMEIDGESENVTNENAESEKETSNADEIDDEDDDDSENYDLFVCTGDINTTKETPHPTDLTKKIVSWSVFNPVCAHHVGWAVGSFQSCELSDFNDGTGAPEPQEDGFEEFEEIEKDESTTSVTLYYLPGQEDLAKNTCIFAHKAIDFFLKEFGSYPFTSYSIVFVSGPCFPYNNFAGLSVLSDSLLYPPDVIEPMFKTTEDILECIAGQWSCINIVPQVFNDIWCTVGIARFMAFQFMRVLMGLNQFRYQIKQKMDKIVRDDVGKRPLGLHSLTFPVSEADFEFLRLKAPVILFILDRRMTKTDKSFGLSRVLPKIFLQAMSGDLQNGTLSTQHFQSVCEKVNRNRLESFFKQWVYGVGTPIFNITQRFNKKRSLIEVVIRQVQVHQVKVTDPKSESFLDESLTYINDYPVYPIQPTFLGPMTIRVHEADGTPYEHIVDIKDNVVKFDVQYNTKFKRLKRNKEDNNEGIPVFAKLGDILDSDKDMSEWNFEEWPKRDEELLDPFEWLRVDTDFEWIARFNVKQPDYMFGSQLQQDRDIEAQIAAIEYFGNQAKPSTIYCTALTRTLMDDRYFYGVRIAAARALAELSRASNGFAGLNYLIMAFKKLFCFEDSTIPKSNYFDDFGKFFLLKALPEILSSIRDDDGKTPTRIKGLLFNLLKYNDNSNNEFQDCFYVCDIIAALTNAVIPITTELRFFDYHLEKENAASVFSEDQDFINKVVQEINRIQKLDSWVPSYQSRVSLTCIEQKIRLAQHAFFDFSFEKLIFLTSKKLSYDIRCMAFKGLFMLGGLKNSHVLKYFLEVCLLEDGSPYFRTNLIKALIDSVNEAAVHGTPSMYDDPEFQSLERLLDTGPGGANQANMVVIEETQSTDMNTRRDALARASIKGAVDILRRDLSIGKGLQRLLWELIHSSLISLFDRRMVFMLCELLYDETDSFPISISVPCVPFEELKKKIVAKNLGDGTVVIKREGRFKILLSTKILLTLGKSRIGAKRESERAAAANRNTRTRSNTNVEEVLLPEPKLRIKLTSSSVAEAPSEALGDTETAATEVLDEPVDENIAEVVDEAADEPIVEEIVDNQPDAEEPLVSRDPSNRMSLKLTFRRHKLAPLDDVETITNGESTDLSNFTIKFTSSRAIRRLRSFNAPNRFVKISTRRGRVSVSATPFDEGETKVKKEPDLNPEVKLEDVKDVGEEEEAEKETSETSKAVSMEIETAKEKSVEPVQASEQAKEAPRVSKVRSNSPFSRDPSPVKKRKTAVYIHGEKSGTLSPTTTSPPEEEAAPEVKTEEVEKPRPKLKLKLTLK